MVALLKYGTGLPFYRIEKLQKNLGIPLPASTQWDLVGGAAEKLLPAYQELVRHAAQGEILYNDDTTMRILELTGERRRKAIAAGDIDPEQRAGIFTSGIVSNSAGIEIALFFTGNKHAGENLSDVLAQRAADLSRPIQMCDAHPQNMDGDFEAILSHCLVHARRHFVEVAANFPSDCRYVINTLRDVYKIEADIHKQGLGASERLQVHQDKTAPKMLSLKEWLDEQISEKLVEPNSGLGKAIKYMRRHWEELTLFLRLPDAPLDNNLCERVLKKVVLHRKNAYFYKTQKGARVGDMFMSLIHTAELCNSDPFEYLVALLRNPNTLTTTPGNWMPWNYVSKLADPATQS